MLLAYWSVRSKIMIGMLLIMNVVHRQVHEKKIIAKESKAL